MVMYFFNVFRKPFTLMNPKSKIPLCKKNWNKNEILRLTVFICMSDYCIRILIINHRDL